MEKKDNEREAEEKGCKKEGKGTAVGIAAVLALLVFVIIAAWPFYKKAENIGKAVGETSGKAAGKAVGSVEGITERIPQGLGDGKEQGLSAEDIEIDIPEKIQAIGVLEILAASVRLDDYLKIADDYSAIYVYKADAIFSVDLQNAVIEKSGGKVTVALKEPQVSFYINEEATEKVAEWQKRFYSGRTEDGYRAYINSRAEIEKRAPEEIRNYAALMELAEDSARRQLTILVESICGEAEEVEIVFTKEGE